MRGVGSVVVCGVCVEMLFATQHSVQPRISCNPPALCWVFLSSTSMALLCTAVTIPSTTTLNTHKPPTAHTPLAYPYHPPTHLQPPLTCTHSISPAPPPSPTPPLTYTPRQDQAARQHPPHQRSRRRSGGHHPANWRHLHPHRRHQKAHCRTAPRWEI